MKLIDNLYKCYKKHSENVIAKDVARRVWSNDESDNPANLDAYTEAREITHQSSKDVTAFIATTIVLYFIASVVSLMAHTFIPLLIIAFMYKTVLLSIIESIPVRIKKGRDRCHGWVKGLEDRGLNTMKLIDNLYTCHKEYVKWARVADNGYQEWFKSSYPEFPLDEASKEYENARSEAEKYSNESCEFLVVTLVLLLTVLIITLVSDTFIPLLILAFLYKRVLLDMAKGLLCISKRLITYLKGCPDDIKRWEKELEDKLRDDT
jgi:hypothetical protein